MVWCCFLLISSGRFIMSTSKMSRNSECTEKKRNTATLIFTVTTPEEHMWLLQVSLSLGVWAKPNLKPVHICSCTESAHTTASLATWLWMLWGELFSGVDHFFLNESTAADLSCWCRTLICPKYSSQCFINSRHIWISPTVQLFGRDTGWSDKRKWTVLILVGRHPLCQSCAKTTGNWLTVGKKTLSSPTRTHCPSVLL